MTPDVVLHQKLSQVGRRIRALLVYRWMTRLLCWTALACVLWLLASRVNWLPEPEPGTVFGVLLFAALAGAGIGLARRVTTMDVARLTDERTAMKERLASAVEFEGQAADDPLAQRQVADARAHAADLDLRRVYPVRFSREAGLFVVFALALFGAYFLPTLPIFWSAERRKEIEEVKQWGRKIEKPVRDTQKEAEKGRLDESAKAAKEALKLAQAMKRGSLNKKNAMIRMAKLTKQIQEQKKRMAAANTPGAKPMERAAAEIKKALEQQQKAVEEAAKAKQEAAKKGEGRKNGKPGEKPGEQKNAQNAAAQQKQTEAMKKAQQALQQFADALAKQDANQQNQALQQLADQLQKNRMTPEEMKQLQQQLQMMANALKNTDLNKVAQQMQQMAQMMRSIKLDPETLKKLAQMMKQAGGT